MLGRAPAVTATSVTRLLSGSTNGPGSSSGFNIQSTQPAITNSARTINTSQLLLTRQRLELLGRKRNESSSLCSTPRHLALQALASWCKLFVHFLCEGPPSDGRPRTRFARF